MIKDYLSDLLDKLVGQFHLSDSKTEILKAHYKSMFDDKLLR